MVNEQSEFWSKIAQKYNRVIDLQIGGRTRSMVCERVTKEGRLGNLAEFGCGTGFYTEILASKAHSVVATDISAGMLASAKEHIRAENLRFQEEDCQNTSLDGASFDTVFMSLVIHFTEPEKTLAEMHRILKQGGVLIISNLDLDALKGIDRFRCQIRIIYHGITGYRIKPPKGFMKSLMTGKQLCKLLDKFGFRVISSETIRDTSRSSNIPVEYIKANKV